LYLHLMRMFVCMYELLVGLYMHTHTTYMRVYDSQVREGVPCLTPGQTAYQVRMKLDAAAAAPSPVEGCPMHHSCTVEPHPPTYSSLTLCRASRVTWYRGRPRRRPGARRFPGTLHLGRVFWDISLYGAYFSWEIGHMCACGHMFFWDICSGRPDPRRLCGTLLYFLDTPLFQYTYFLG
jgi:hypothetical protein